jgi:hypothetical protein
MDRHFASILKRRFYFVAAHGTSAGKPGPGPCDRPQIALAEWLMLDVSMLGTTGVIPRRAPYPGGRASPPLLWDNDENDITAFVAALTGA